MSHHNEPRAVLYVKLVIALADFAAIVLFGYLEVATEATVPFWFMAVLLAIFSAVLGVNALQRVTDGPGSGPGSGGGGGGGA